METTPQKYRVKKCHLCNYSTTNSSILSAHIVSNHVNRKTRRIFCKICKYDVRNNSQHLKSRKHKKNEIQKNQGKCSFY